MSDPTNPFAFDDPEPNAPASGRRGGRAGDAPEPDGPNEPPAHERTRADELPDPWADVYKGFRTLQGAGAVIGGGLVAMAVSVVVANAAALQVGIGVLFLPSLLILGVGSAVWLAGQSKVRAMPPRFCGREPGEGVPLVFFLFGFPIAVLIFAGQWVRFLGDLGRRLRDRDLEASARRAGRLALAGAFLLVVAPIALIVAAKANARAPQESKLVASLPACAAFATGGLLIGGALLAAHGAAARAVLRRAPDEPEARPDRGWEERESSSRVARRRSRGDD